MLTSTSLSQVLTLSPFNSARVEGGWYRVALYKMPTGNPPPWICTSPISIRRMSSTQGKKQNKTMKKKNMAHLLMLLANIPKSSTMLGYKYDPTLSTLLILNFSAILCTKYQPL